MEVPVAAAIGGCDEVRHVHTDPDSGRATVLAGFIGNRVRTRPGDVAGSAALCLHLVRVPWG